MGKLHLIRFTHRLQRIQSWLESLIKHQRRRYFRCDSSAQVPAHVVMLTAVWTTVDFMHRVSKQTTTKLSEILQHFSLTELESHVVSLLKLSVIVQQIWQIMNKYTGMGFFSPPKVSVKTKINNNNKNILNHETEQSMWHTFNMFPLSCSLLLISFLLIFHFNTSKKVLKETKMNWERSFESSVVLSLQQSDCQ